MWYLYIIILILVGYIIYTYKKEQTNKNLEALKNALLTLAMTDVFKDKFEHGPITTVLDGTQLPPMSGYNMSNACFSYIIDEDEFKKNPFYTPIMANKYKAVDKFLELNLSTEKQVSEFFENVVQKYIKKED